MNILNKLDQEIYNIHIKQKLASGNILNENDINILFKILKDRDIEVKPLLIMIENFILNESIEKNYHIIEKTVISLLKYYNLLENDDFTTCRHKYFFSENRKLIKKKYFTEEHIKDIKTNINTIYNKI